MKTELITKLSTSQSLELAASRPVDISRALRIEGWMSQKELLWLGAVATRSATIIELGSWKGRSTRVLAEHVIGRVIAVDHFEGDAGAAGGREIFHAFMRNLHDIFHKITLVQKSAQQAFLSLSLELPFGVDLVFIDDDHSYQNVLMNIKSYRALVRRGGILAGHDYGVWPGVTQAVDQVFGRVNHVQSIWWKTL